MVRGKTEVKRIENESSRQVTFSKRKNGLLKKAFELSVLCDADVGLIVFSPRGKLYEFSSSSMQKTVDRYMTQVKGANTDKRPTEQNLQQLQKEATSMAKEIEAVEAHRRKLLGESLESSTVEELHDIEFQLERSLSNIRRRKNHLLVEQIAQLREKENAVLLQKFKVETRLQLCSSPSEVNPSDSTSGEEDTEVETELLIGRPGTRRSILPSPTEVSNLRNL
nr:suppressor of overexpression of constans 1 [Iris germanica]